MIHIFTVEVDAHRRAKYLLKLTAAEYLKLCKFPTWGFSNIALFSNLIIFCNSQRKLKGGIAFCRSLGFNLHKYNERNLLTWFSRCLHFHPSETVDALCGFHSLLIQSYLALLQRKSRSLKLYRKTGDLVEQVCRLTTSGERWIESQWQGGNNVGILCSAETGYRRSYDNCKNNWLMLLTSSCYNWPHANSFIAQLTSHWIFCRSS